MTKDGTDWPRTAGMILIVPADQEDFTGGRRVLSMTSDELERLQSEHHASPASLDRIVGILRGHPLALERDQFTETERIIRTGFNMPKLADRLLSAVEQHGGLLSKEEAQMRYAEQKDEVAR